MLEKQIEETPKYQDEIQRIMDECLPKTVIDDGYYQMTIAKISSVIIQSNSQLLDTLKEEVDESEKILLANLPFHKLDIRSKWYKVGVATAIDEVKGDLKTLINNLKKGL